MREREVVRPHPQVACWQWHNNRNELELWVLGTPLHPMRTEKVWEDGLAYETSSDKPSGRGWDPLVTGVRGAWGASKDRAKPSHRTMLLGRRSRGAKLSASGTVSIRSRLRGAGREKVSRNA